MSPDSTSIMKVFDVMSTDVVTSGISEVLDQATTWMLERAVGCIVVTNKGVVAGIITKGDILRKAFLKGIAADKVTAKKVMTRPVVTISPDSSLEEASRLMTAEKVSKLPVVRDRKLVGIITSTDVIRAEPIQVGYLQELVRARFVPHDLR